MRIIYTYRETSPLMEIPTPTPTAMATVTSTIVINRYLSKRGSRNIRARSAFFGRLVDVEDLRRRIVVGHFWCCVYHNLMYISSQLDFLLRTNVLLNSGARALASSSKAVASRSGSGARTMSWCSTSFGVEWW